MPISMIWIAVLGGTAAGLIVNFLSDVLPLTRRLSQPACLVCRQPMRLFDYLLGRPCATCGTVRSWRYWAVWIVFISASALTWWRPSHRLGYLAGLALLVYFGVVVVIDIEHRVVLTQVSLFGVVLGAALGIWSRGFTAAFLGGLAGFGIMLGLYFLGQLYAKWLGRRRKLEGPPEEDSEEVALGFGDVNLTAVLGLILGWPVIVGGLLAGIVAGGLVSLVYILILIAIKKYQVSQAIPYAPFLVLGAVIFLYVL